MRRALARYREFLKWYRQPEQQKVLYKYRKWFWIVLLVVSIPTGWIFSVALISALSIIALFIGDSSAEQAVDAQLEQKKQTAQTLKWCSWLLPFETRGSTVARYQNYISHPASIKVMHQTLNLGNTGRYRGGVRVDTQEFLC